MNDLGNLTSCVMDSDSAATGRERRLRRKAFVASIILEAALVGALLLWPLLATSVLPAQATVTPVPPYRAERAAPEIAPSRGSTRPAVAVDFLPNLHPAVHRPISTDTNGGPPSLGNFPLGSGPDAGPMIPGASRDGRPIEVPAPPQPPKRPISVSAGVMAALLIHRVQPDYPDLAKAMHLSGTVELQARIGTDGSVQALEVVSGNPILARAALEAVEQWRYQPTRLSGQPVEVETHITVSFTLQE